MREIFFYIVILLSNIIQGITGFAGTILAMPFSIKLVGMDTAVPVLNFLGLLSGIYVCAGNYKKINWVVLKRVVVIMGISLFCGIHIKSSLSGNPKLLYMILGCIVLFVAIKGMIVSFIEKANKQSDNPSNEQRSKHSPLQNALLTLLLIAAGIVHGMFVCGGPLLISYMTRKLPEKASFRATISTVWIFLNGFLLVTHIFQGLWTPGVIKSGAISIPFLLGGMFIGGKLYSKMSQEFFVTLTYILLLIAGISLFLK
ncbi:sulfite exporter TauE/SafE family protein [Butyrivibrio sp. VCB2006]|uniref:sulfite exporter TauE/SafE family protein n=1 Tax=Butyrivibrio sp. VCB2006 TaxID=1280679 RepID=UPI00041E0914|nr:sulfite exporter TauE/SafE family protein [Butyrivibrio sp. VCB2006]